MSDAVSSPFDDIRRLITTVPGPDEAAVEAVRMRDRQLTKPAGSLGRLEWIAEWLAAWQAKPNPSVDRPLVCVFAASHGVTAKGVSAFPSDVNRQMLENFAAGGAAINQICAAYGLGFKVFDLAIDMPTGDITEADAMDEKACVATMAFGMEAIAGGTDLLAVGEMGIGNTTVAAALCLGLFGGSAAEWTGPGTGVGGAALKAKRQAVASAAARHVGAGDPFEILRRLGGLELAALTGAVLAARMGRVPVILDGYATTAAAAVLYAADPRALDHCLVAHVSAEPGHRRLLERIGKQPLFDLGMRLGEASGATLAFGVVKAAAACHAGMATFGEAGVSGPA